MKKQYAEKINRMRKTSMSLMVATHFAEHEGLAVTNADIMALTGMDAKQSRQAVTTLTASGWVIDNIAPAGKEARWVLRGVGTRKGGMAKIQKPKLNPLIEAVFC